MTLDERVSLTRFAEGLADLAAVMNRASLSLPPGLVAGPDRCEEASHLSHAFYVPCNAPAARMIGFPSGEGPYRMCLPCASHNTRNRGARDLGPFPSVDAAMST